jgi:hypothetical protein
MFGRVLRRFVIARAALCGVAVLAQATVPVAHAIHIASSHQHTAAGVHHEAGRTPGHDAASCVLCAKLAHCRADRMPPGWSGPVLHAVPGAPDIDAPVILPAAALSASGPRAPPALSA